MRKGRGCLLSAIPHTQGRRLTPGMEEQKEKTPEEVGSEYISSRNVP